MIRWLRVTVQIEGVDVKARMHYMFLLITLATLTAVHPAAIATGDVQAGKAIYERLCLHCHGPTGQGGRMATMLAVSPRDLTDQAYMSTRSDQQLFTVISQGSAAMTAFGDRLAEQQIWDTVAYVRTLTAASST